MLLVRRIVQRGCAVALAASLLCACRQSVDLVALAKLADTADEQEPVFASLAADFYGSCRRQQEWRAIGAEEPRIDRAARAVTIRSGAVSALSASEPDPCKTAADATRQWQTVDSVVLDYVRSIGHLAGGGRAGDDAYGLEALSSSLGTQGVFDPTRSSAIGAAASTLANDIFDEQRREHIAALTPQGQHAFETLVDSLESVAVDDYRGMLRLERNDVNHFFRDGFHAGSAGMPAYESLQYRRAWKDELTRVDARGDAVVAYVGTLEALKRSQRALIERVRANDRPAIAAIVLSYISEYRPKLAAIARAGGASVPAPAP